MNQFFAEKIISCQILTELFLEHKSIFANETQIGKFRFNNLIVHNLLMNYLNQGLNLIKDVWCSVSVLKSRKQPLADVLQNRCSSKLCNIQTKTPVLESLFNELQVCNFPANIADLLRTVFFIKHLQWLLLKNLQIFQENISSEGVIDLTF